MILGSLSFAGWGWLAPAALFVGLAVAILVWGYRATPAGGRRWACLGLKLAGILALAFCLLDRKSTRLNSSHT